MKTRVFTALFDGSSTTIAATHTCPVTDGDRGAFKLAGFGRSDESQSTFILMTALGSEITCSDPSQWRNPHSRLIHEYILSIWDQWNFDPSLKVQLKYEGITIKQGYLTFSVGGTKTVNYLDEPLNLKTPLLAVLLKPLIKPTTPFILLTHLETLESHSSPEWRERDLNQLHRWILGRWNYIVSGEVVTSEVIRTAYTERSR